MPLRVCQACKGSKSEEEFSFKNKALGKLHTHCRQCQQTYKRNHYERNKQEYKARSALAKIRSIKRNQRFILDYLAFHPCVKCGDPDSMVLEFDYQGEKSKRFVSSLWMGVPFSASLTRSQSVKSCVRAATAEKRVFSLGGCTGFSLVARFLFFSHNRIAPGSSVG